MRIVLSEEEVLKRPNWTIERIEKYIYHGAFATDQLLYSKILLVEQTNSDVFGLQPFVPNNDLPPYDAIDYFGLGDELNDESDYESDDEFEDWFDDDFESDFDKN